MIKVTLIIHIEVEDGGQSQEFKDATLLALKMEEEVISQGK